MSSNPGGTPRPRAGVDEMYDALRSAIVENRLEPGQRLIEQQLAAEYGASRTPVREALRRLEAEGLVITERHRGAIVRPLSFDEVLDLYGLRARLESYAAELAAERRSDDDLDALGAAVDLFTDAVAMVDDGHGDDGHGDDGDGDDGAFRQLADANRAVHDRIVAAARHARLATMLSRTVDIPLVFQSLRRFGPAERARSDIFHRLILAAIERGEPARAGALMSEHILQGLDGVIGDLDHVERA